MNRLKAILLLMKYKKLKNYLEIGVFNGHIFFRIKSKFKIAIDPYFTFDKLRIVGKLFLNPYNVFNKYYKKTSDHFFENDSSSIFTNKQIDISLIDGMHEYDYSKRDVENVLNHLSKDGVIIMHDCNPITKAASCSFEQWGEVNYKGIWNGDVWKTIVYLRSTRSDLNVFVLDCDYGLGFISKSLSPNKLLPYTEKQIREMEYEDLEKNRDEFLNLKSPNYFYEFFDISCP